MSKLHEQREVIVRTRDKAGDVNELTSTGRRILLRMQGRVCTNKLLLWAIIVVLLICIGCVVYFGYISGDMGGRRSSEHKRMLR
jgi:hypothetical protein